MGDLKLSSIGVAIACTMHRVVGRTTCDTGRSLDLNGISGVGIVVRFFPHREIRVEDGDIRTLRPVFDRHSEQSLGRIVPISLICPDAVVRRGLTAYANATRSDYIGLMVTGIPRVTLC